MQYNFAEELKENNQTQCNIDNSMLDIFKDVFKYAPSKIIGAIINLLMVSVYTNLISPKEYGLYMVATGVISFLAIIFSDWIGTSALRFFREHFKKDNIQSYFSTIFLLLIINLSVMYALSFIFINPIKDFFNISPKFLLIVLVLLIPIAARALLFQVLRAQIKPLTYTFSIVFNQITTVLASFCLIKYYHFGAVGMLMGMGISITLIDIIMLFQTSYHNSVDHEKIKLNILSGLYRYGTPLALSSLGMWLITQSNRFILQRFKGSAYNGHLGVGYNLTYSIMMPLFSILSLAAIPRIINYYEDGKDVRPLITMIIEKYFIWFTPIALFLCIYSKETVMVFSNPDFLNAHILIPFLSVSAFCLGLTELTTIQYYLVKKTEIDMVIRLISGIFGIVLNIILLPKYSLFAVGFAALASQVLYFILSYMVKIKQVNWVFPYKTLLKSFIAISFCIIVSVFAKNIIEPVNIWLFIVNAGIFCLVYVTVIKFFKKFLNLKFLL